MNCFKCGCEVKTNDEDIRGEVSGTNTPDPESGAFVATFCPGCSQNLLAFVLNELSRTTGITPRMISERYRAVSDIYESPKEVSFGDG